MKLIDHLRRINPRPVDRAGDALTADARARLRALLREEASAADVTAAIEAGERSGAAASATRGSAPRRGQPRPWLQPVMAGAVVLVVVAATVGGVAAWRNRAPGQPASPSPTSAPTSGTAGLPSEEPSVVEDTGGFTWTEQVYIGEGLDPSLCWDYGFSQPMMGDGSVVVFNLRGGLQDPCFSPWDSVETSSRWLLRGVSATEARVVWTQDLNELTGLDRLDLGSVATDGRSLVFIGADSADRGDTAHPPQVFIFDLATGAVLAQADWSWSRAGQGDGAAEIARPVAWRDGVIVWRQQVDNAWSVYLATPQDAPGTELWRASGPTSAAGDLALAGRWILTSEGYVNVADGLFAGFGQDGSDYIAIVRLQDGRTEDVVLRLTTADGLVQAVAWDTVANTALWPEPVPFGSTGQWATAEVAGQTLLVSDSAQIAAYNLADGAALWTWTQENRQIELGLPAGSGHVFALAGDISESDYGLSDYWTIHLLDLATGAESNPQASAYDSYDPDNYPPDDRTPGFWFGTDVTYFSVRNVGEIGVSTTWMGGIPTGGKTADPFAWALGIFGTSLAEPQVYPAVDLSHGPVLEEWDGRGWTAYDAVAGFVLTDSQPDKTVSFLLLPDLAAVAAVETPPEATPTTPAWLNTALADLPADYPADQAAADGLYVVGPTGDVTANAEAKATFLANAAAGTPARFRAYATTVEGGAVIAEFAYDGVTFGVVYDDSRDGFAADPGYRVETYEYLVEVTDGGTTWSLLCHRADVSLADIDAGEDCRVVGLA